MLLDEQTSPKQFAIYRAMTGQQRWEIAQQLYWSARKLKTAEVRAQHPDWSEWGVEQKVKMMFLAEAMKES